MNRVVRLSRSEERLEAASRWVLKLDEGLGVEEHTALEAWLAEHPSNAAELVEVAEAWDKLDSLSRLSSLFPLVDARVRAQPPARRGGRPWAVAAGLSSLGIVALLLLLNAGTKAPDGFDSGRPAPATTARYETPIGSQKTVLLPDGSEVVLNTHSSLDVRYTDEARVLYLYRGEIHVEVAEDPIRPLSVVARDRVVQAVGTSFSIEITDEQTIELVVVEGKVVVGVHPRPVSASPSNLAAEAGAEPATATPPILEQLDSNTVSAGEALVLGTDESVKTAVTEDEIEVKLSWREGRLIFRSEPLADVLAEVQRYTTVEFVLLDDDLKTRTLTGRFRAGDVDTFLASLRLNFRIVHEYDGDKRILLSKL